MKRAKLALVLLVLLSSFILATESVALGESIDDADLRIPSPTRSLSSSGQGATPYIEDVAGSHWLWLLNLAF